MEVRLWGKKHPLTVEHFKGELNYHVHVWMTICIYMILKDYYYISSHALDRFCMPTNAFHDVQKTHENCASEDLEMLQGRSFSNEAGIKHFHNLQYRWLGLDGQPIWINCRGRTVNGEDGQPMCMVGCINEIGAKQKADNVSGLLGETSLQEYLYTIGRCFRKDSFCVSVLMILKTSMKIWGLNTEI